MKRYVQQIKDCRTLAMAAIEGPGECYYMCTQSTYRANYVPGGLLSVIPYTCIFALT